jgi:hypothetical protein
MNTVAPGLKWLWGQRCALFLLRPGWWPTYYIAKLQCGCVREVCMHAAARDIYDVFLDEGRVKAFTMSDATVSKEVNGKFSMFGGSIEGVHRELVPGKKIVQDWRFTTWPDQVYSLVHATPPALCCVVSI